jgi:hypothetical protein
MACFWKLLNPRGFAPCYMMEASLSRQLMYLQQKMQNGSHGRGGTAWRVSVMAHGTCFSLQATAWSTFEIAQDRCTHSP